MTSIVPKADRSPDDKRDDRITAITQLLAELRNLGDARYGTSDDDSTLCLTSLLTDLMWWVRSMEFDPEDFQRALLNASTIFTAEMEDYEAYLETTVFVCAPKPS